MIDVLAEWFEVLLGCLCPLAAGVVVTVVLGVPIVLLARAMARSLQSESWRPGPGWSRADYLAERMEDLGLHEEAEELRDACAGRYGVSEDALNELESEIDHCEDGIAALF